VLASQFKLQINNAFCIVQRAAEELISGFFCAYGATEALPGFQSSWSDFVYFSLSFFV
jgi:hypothetical protein